jgi:hypothetical protein
VGNDTAHANNHTTTNVEKLFHFLKNLYGSLILNIDLNHHANNSDEHISTTQCILHEGNFVPYKNIVQRYCAQQGANG